MFFNSTGKDFMTYFTKFAQNIKYAKENFHIHSLNHCWFKQLC